VVPLRARQLAIGTTDHRLEWGDGAPSAPGRPVGIPSASPDRTPLTSRKAGPGVLPSTQRARQNCIDTHNVELERGGAPDPAVLGTLFAQRIHVTPAHIAVRPDRTGGHRDVVLANLVAAIPGR
jgi:hypothetical protein